MVEPSEFKKEIRKRVIQEYSIEFLGDNFDVSEIIPLATEAGGQSPLSNF